MRLLVFVAVVLGIGLVFGLVYGVSALLERKKAKPQKQTRTLAPDDDPEFLRNLARKLDEQGDTDDR